LTEVCILFYIIILIICFLGEGPYGLIIVPSRELAKQIYDVVEWLVVALENDGRSRLRVGLAIGGMPIKDQARTFERLV
jgi:ATP-dependent RNA helicase DDX41